MKFRHRAISNPEYLRTSIAPSEIRPENVNALLYYYAYSNNSYEIMCKSTKVTHPGIWRPPELGGPVWVVYKEFIDNNSLLFENPFVIDPSIQTTEYHFDKGEHILVIPSSLNTLGGKCCILKIKNDFINYLLYTSAPVPNWFVFYGTNYGHANALIFQRKSGREFTFDRFEPQYNFNEMRSYYFLHAGMSELFQRGISRVLATPPDTVFVKYNDPWVQTPSEAPLFNASHIFKQGPQSVEVNIINYTGEPVGYCALWSVLAINRYMEYYERTNTTLDFVRWMGNIYYEMGVVDTNGDPVSPYESYSITLFKRVRKYIQEYAGELFTPERKLSDGSTIKELICRQLSTMKETNEYLLRSFVNVYFNDPQPVFNSIVNRFFGGLRLNKISLKYYGEHDFSRGGDSLPLRYIELIRNPSEREVEKRLFQSLLKTHSINPLLSSVFAPLNQNGEPYGVLMWFADDVVKGKTRKVVWSLKLPLNYLSQLSNLNAIISILYLEDMKVVSKIDVGHTNLLTTLKTPDNRLSFVRFDPDYQSSSQKYELVNVDGDGKWTTALASGILNISHMMSTAEPQLYQRFMGKLRDGVKIRSVLTNTTLEGLQTIERNVPREYGEFIGYCQTWSLRLLEISVTRNIVDPDFSLRLLYQDVGSYTDPVAVRRYIRKQASRYVSYVVGDIFKCN